MAKRSGRRAFSRGPKNYIWTAVLLENVTVATTVLRGENIVTASDWVTSAQGFERATLLSVRGWISWHNLGSVSVDCKFMIVKQGDTEPDIDAANILSYTEEDVLWTGGDVVPASTVAANGNPFVMHYDIDIKAKRKLSSGNDIALFIAPNGASVTVSTVLRALVDRG